MAGPLGLSMVVARRSTGRWCVRVHIPLRCDPVHIPVGRPPGRVCAVRSCPPPTDRRPAQRARHSPSQGRRPWRAVPTTSRQAQRVDRSSNRAGDVWDCWPGGPTTVVLGTFPSPMGWAGGMAGPLGLSMVVARRSTGRWCVRVHIPLRCDPVHIPVGRPPGRVCAVRSCPLPTGRRPAQRARHSPSQGRRPWRAIPTTSRQAQRADRSIQSQT
jgi:hypothetical protein